jgi:hypothetical protein
MGTLKRRWIESMEPTEEPPMEQERLHAAASGYTEGVSAGAESKPTLTDEERASVVRAIETLEGVEYLEAFSTENDATAAATLRGLLERLTPTGEK